ncbi:hypothetical protein, partial [Massilia sp. PWRC2]|uniref:hypothetical protein n=1 Tax=Massilia sp. PWRC2 TaxID=2804626 RepID=UPI003CEB6C1E
VKRSAGSPRWWFIPNTWLGYNCRPIRFINPVLHLILETARFTITAPTIAKVYVLNNFFIGF